MTREQLEHAIRAACDVAQDTELYVFGSQAILGMYPNAPFGLRGSIEVDVQPKNKPDKAIDIDGAIGELSPFHEQFGFYVHGISIEVATLPKGWVDRTVAVCDTFNTRGNTGHCLDAHDLAASKLVAGRDKDRRFVTTLLIENLVDSGELLARTDGLPIEKSRIQDLQQWIRATALEISESE